jgi:hypothetical protein
MRQLMQGFFRDLFGRLEQMVVVEEEERAAAGR